MPPPKGTWNPIEGPGDYTTTKQVHSDTYPAIDPTKSDLSGKAVFITGASRGLGKAIAISFAKGGASFIALSARSSCEETEKAAKEAAKTAGRKEPKILSLKLDVTDNKKVNDAAKRIEKEFGGKIDILINNAGIMGGREAIGDSDPDTWWQTWNVNVRAPYLIARACLPLLLKSELKTLIMVASVGALVVGPTLSDYQASKHALVRVTDFIAKENEEHGLTAYSIHPGNMLTDIVDNGENMTPELKAVFTEKPELCADGLVYLCKEQRQWLTGRYVNMTWDLPEFTSEKLRKKIVDGDLLKVKLAVP